MSSIRLLILGVLQRKQPIHGYDVRRELEQWHADKWANVAYGSIYSALNKMAEEGLIQAISTDHGKHQTSRTEYITTEHGKQEFERLLHEYWWELKPAIDPFQIALTFIDKLSPAELENALQHRATQLQSSIMALKQTVPARANGSQVSRHIPVGLHLMLAQTEAELQWIEEVLFKVRHGELP